MSFLSLHADVRRVRPRHVVDGVRLDLVDDYHCPLGSLHLTYEHAFELLSALETCLQAAEAAANQE